MRGLLRMINDSDKENEGWLNKKDKFREKVKNFLYKIWFSKWLILLVVISIVSPIFIYLQVAQSEIISDNTKGDFESLGDSVSNFDSSYSNHYLDCSFFE